MRIGAHISISKGLDKACNMTEEIKGNTFQFFTRNPRGGRARKISSVEINTFSKLRESMSIVPIVGHLPYTVNLAAEKKETYDFASDIVEKDLERGETIGAEYLVVHPGRNKAKKEGLNKIVNLLERNLVNFKGDCLLLLETMVGGGSEIGTIEDLKEIFNALKGIKNLGVCLDTCHLFAAGWDFRNDETISILKDKLDRYIGLEKVKVIHLNDSLHPLSSGKDRHAKICEGFIGNEGISNLINDAFFGNLPLILETPVESYQQYSDEINKVVNLVKESNN